MEELHDIFLPGSNMTSDCIITGLEDYAIKPSTSKMVSPVSTCRPADIWRDIEDDDDDELIFDGKGNNTGRNWDNHNQYDHCDKFDEAEQLVQRLKTAEETYLIDFEDDAELVCLTEDEKCEIPVPSSSTENVPNEGEPSESVNPNLLPSCAIIYDYTMQPVMAREQKRRYLPHLNTSSSPFLRPIVIDGVGLVKAYRNCCCTNTTYFPFPIVPIIRCLFYWISKGHSAVLCFPSKFNPIDDEVFNATPVQKDIIQKLRRFKMCTVFETKSEEDNRKWYSNVLEIHRACLITTVSQWRLSMPNNLISGVITRSDGFSNYSINSNGRNHIYRENRPERLLQPFFSHEGKLVFFSSFSSQGTCVADMILDNAILDIDEFQRLNDNQLSFIEQARMLKVLHSFVPSTSRFRETAVMVKILERLKPFLP